MHGLPFRIGCDICQISRIQRILDGRHALRFAQRILRPEEQHELTRRYAREVTWKASAKGTVPTTPTSPDLLLSVLPKAATFIAGRFAAKEAVFKANPRRFLSFQDVAVLREQQLQLQSQPKSQRDRKNQESKQPSPQTHPGSLSEKALSQVSPQDDVGSRRPRPETVANSSLEIGPRSASAPSPTSASELEPNPSLVEVRSRFSQEPPPTDTSNHPKSTPDSPLDSPPIIHPHHRAMLGPTSGSGAPVAKIFGQPSQGIPDQWAQISLSHDGDYAMAVCLVMAQE